MTYKEAAIQAEIMRYLSTVRGVWFWRQNVGAARRGRSVVTFGFPGMSDISGILSDGRRLEIEVKAPNGRVSPEQALFISQINRFGGVAFVARSVDDVVTGLAEAGHKGGQYVQS